MDTYTKHIAVTIKNALFWQMKATQELQAGDIAGAARTFDHVSELMHRAEVEALHRYYNTGLQDQIPNWEQILKKAAQSARKELEDEE